MTIIGKPNEVTRPNGRITGAGSIDISGLRCVLAVGAIPMCRVSVPPQALGSIPDEQTGQLYTVTVGDKDGGDHVLFKGYVVGDSVSVQGESVSGGIDLIHPAADLDWTRISAPSLHPGTIMDYDYTYRGSGGFSGGGSAFMLETYYKAGGGKVPEQLIKGLIASLKEASSSSGGGDGENPKTETLESGIKLLSKIKVLDGELEGSIESAVSGDENNSINVWARSSAEGSFSAVRSVWDTIAVLFAEMGVNLICSGDGEILAAVDYAGLNESKNTIEPEQIAFFDKNSAMLRNIGQVALQTDALIASAFSNTGPPGGFISYPKNGGSGATLCIQVPGWLNPVAKAKSQGDKELIKAWETYAEMIYHLERNKTRFMNVTTPLAPYAVPGTIATVTPLSKMKALNGGGVADFQKSYIGYCYQVAHEINVNQKIMQTTFSFRNVSVTGSGSGVSKNPMFTDAKPFAWK